MTPEELRKTVNDILVDELGCDINEITPNADLIVDLGADSLDQVEIVFTLEAEFNIDISEEEAEACKTVGQLYSLLERRVL